MPSAFRRDGCGQRKVHVPVGQLLQAIVAGTLPEFEDSVGVAAAEGADEQGKRRFTERVLERDPDRGPSPRPIRACTLSSPAWKSSSAASM